MEIDRFQFAKKIVDGVFLQSLIRHEDFCQISVYTRRRAARRLLDLYLPKRPTINEDTTVSGFQTSVHLSLGNCQRLYPRRQ